MARKVPTENAGGKNFRVTKVRVALHIKTRESICAFAQMIAIDAARTQGC